jgi:hypothetical protein
MNSLKLSRLLVPILIASSLIMPVFILTSCKKEQNHNTDTNFNYVGKPDASNWKGITHYVQGITQAEIIDGTQTCKII